MKKMKADLNLLGAWGALQYLMALFAFFFFLVCGAGVIIFKAFSSRFEEDLSSSSFPSIGASSFPSMDILYSAFVASSILSVCTIENANISWYVKQRK